MTIMTRMLRLCKADLHGVLDELEDQGLTLKQSLREMEEVIERREARIQNMAGCLEAARREHEQYALECVKLDQDVSSAIEGGHDDIAKRIIKRLSPLAGHRDQLERHIQTLSVDMKQLSDRLDGQRLQYEQLRLKSREFFHQAECRGRAAAVPHPVQHIGAREPTDEEVEFELLRRKENLKGGVPS